MSSAFRRSSFSLNRLPPDIATSLKRWNALFVFFFFLQLVGWFLALFWVGADTDQGNVYRIMFVHVPVAWCGFLWIFLGAVWGLCTLASKEKPEKYDRSSHASIEVGTLFAFLTLVTGSLWGRPTWGVWWDWDPRLTSSLVMFLVCCGYLVLRYFTPDARSRMMGSAVVSILCAVNVPIVYFSVNLWRSLHQPQTFVLKAQNASSDITFVLFYNFIAMTLFSLALYKIRRQSIAAQETLESVRGVS